MREDKNFQISEWFIKFSIQITKKIKQIFENSVMLKNSVNLKEMTYIRIHFFQCGSRIRTKNKWILSTDSKGVYLHGSYPPPKSWCFFGDVSH